MSIKNLDNNLIIRKMLRSDIAPCADIEKTVLDSWSEAQLTEEFENENAYNFTAELNGEICGFSSFHLICDEASLNTISVKEGFRNKGIGRQLLQLCIKQLTQNGAEKIFLEVRSLNSSAIALYKSLGFAEIQKRKNMYTRPNDDAVCMMLGAVK